ncbi:ferrous iron transport protein B [Baia soyae]|uniref:Ferrous iron transport protein B n=1 Tax=Baia soyae TaxID=1544746 RepID=A0A4V2SYK1_9BACL|nr:ferrous iron transport protein B [Baia soyae]
MKSIALAGNPNTGKTSLFNMLTKSYEYVGNWTGVTVEKKVGKLKSGDAELVDLPGIYSLNPLSKDEGVSIHYLMNEMPSTIINIVDGSLLERNLNLTVQLLEYGQPLLIGLNMVDIAKSRGIRIDQKKLAKLLGVPVVPIIARTGSGCDEVLDKLDQSVSPSTFQIDYGEIIEQAISVIDARLEADPPYHHRWLAIQFLEGNQVVKDKLSAWIPEEDLNQLYDQTEKRIKDTGESHSLPSYIYKARNERIKAIIGDSVHVEQNSTTNWTEKIDRILLNRFLGIPLFLAVMYLVFQFTFDWLGSQISDQLDGFLSGPVSDGLTWLLTTCGASSFIKSVVLEGIVSGVGGVLVFVPQIFILFFFISWLEDSGYMARIALLMDRLMSSVGLNGKAFIPMIIGFGCNVPGIMAARTIEHPKERLLTILLSPLMSCSARLTVYALFAAAFFSSHQSLIVLSLYVLSIVTALLLAKLFSSTFLKHEDQSAFVIELPPYRVPQWRILLRSTWEKGKGFVRKAGTFIFGGSVVIWLLSYSGPSGFDVEMNQSFLAIIGNAIAPLFDPIGFGNWQAGASLLTGFLAKEVVVSTMNINDA